MAHVSVTGDTLTVEVEGLDRLWALKSRIEIPLRNIRGATADPGITREPKGLRAPGTHFPGVIVAGTFHRDGEKVFWDVKNPELAVVVELSDEKYTRLVVEVTDPRATVALIEQALRD
ncbi:MULTISPECIES: hypothetical protein [unclassified Kitasatospora]|uniref:hypothetical protein n=1 Tax=unclassified Kitasatospora TaxID=2633591 RepID=UPI00070B76D4|nr:MULTISPECIES: hypothetical protein [unclassified Kitasatospora]KQV04684.1 hypothetical protein ASC99_14980 [Kitasatospora sp. Root107]KRB60792.1 hypothetical protein ASE03_10535 [Kitasatospora sp. Root187]